MARHIHKTEAHAIFLPESETQINCDATALFFGQTIGVRARQRLDQRGLAVVNVPGGANDDALHRSGHMGMGENPSAAFDATGGKDYRSNRQDTTSQRRFLRRWPG